MKDDYLLEYINDHYDSIDGTDDVSAAITKFLRDMLDNLEYDSPAVKILKGTYQKVVFPAYYLLKYGIGIDRMRDCRGTWRIEIRFDRNRIVITHIKNQSIPSENFVSNEPEAEFEWEVSLIFSRDMEKLVSTTVRIRNYQIFDGVEKARVKKLRKGFKKFTS
eukprot:TRINITY_DN9355_c0_g1_i2.p1 TRINITY_DN9355_c0_g1~~TRINITY_DN9355_c0_g1_i2.p1  ORF type:complete len:163 (-),score=40.10 TRINITY_DN9355_c0_g1_i2:42-530(-)